jgi:hypothetical protein
VRDAEVSASFSYGASIEDARNKLIYDLYYLKNRSLVLDLMVLMATVRVVIFQQGARYRSKMRRRPSEGQQAPWACEIVWEGEAIALSAAEVDAVAVEIMTIQKLDPKDGF